MPTVSPNPNVSVFDSTIALLVLLFDAQSGELVSNVTLTNEHSVLFEHLQPATLYSGLLYAINEQGKSSPVRLQTATLGPPEKRQMSQGTWTQLLITILFFEQIALINFFSQKNKNKIEQQTKKRRKLTNSCC